MRLSTFDFVLRRLLPAAAMVFVLTLFAPSQAKAQTWLVSTESFVKLGVVDKFGQLGAFTAKFVVISQRNGKEYTLVKEIEKGQNGIDVVYPSLATEADYFKASSGEAGTAAPGSYTWECQVNGKKVVGGRFSFSEVANDVNLISKQ
ncbi:hypothetical protein [Hymenobacter actinosclerus]|uniref:Uncharacterized protein n=1 Tax=Hymenobacter actinosclerus TaxID=82805 RepID=A0A1I0GHF3_9BACT|nr:hypothetical protein [Hymenobacter actinosclerus]SET70450.1 hypothetical protein SAMN04487998_2417 [Hymenobacter actinosclerus]